MHFRITGLTTTALGAGLIAGPAAAQTLDLSLTIPRLSVAEYHAPYVAVWLEKEGSPARTLAVLYDLDHREGGGTKWLHDLRQWWRLAGRSMKVPADGVTSATRGPGTHELSFTPARAGMGPLAAGNYTLVVEAAREVGGREIVRLPFGWKGTGRATANAKGASELGAMSLVVRR